MKIAEAIARWCSDIRAPFVAGIPGNGILEIVDQLDRRTDVPFILTRHEQGAAMMAYSYAFHTRRPAVAVGSKAPGAANLAIGVMGAFVESLPMIVITAQVNSRREGCEAFEEIDLAAFFKPISKWSVEVHHPERTLEILNEAYRRSLSGRPGPVHVAIPYDFMNHEVQSYVPPGVPVPLDARGAGLEDVVETLRAAKRPVIIAGGGVPFANAPDVLALATILDAPVVESWLRKPVPDRDERCVGMAGIGGSPAAQYAIANADVALVFGCRFSEQMTEHYRMTFAEGAKLIHIDIDPAVIGRVYETHLGIQGDLRFFLPRLRERLEQAGLPADSDRSTWRQRTQALQAGYLGELDRYRRDAAQPQGRRVVEQLRGLLPADAVLVLDSGNYLHWAEQYFPIPEPGLFHYPTSGTMGFGIPGAIGAKFAHPGRLVCALVGDGGFAMTMSELETSMRERIPILVVIINNHTLGHIRIRQEANFDGRCVGVNFSDQHFALVAQAFGAHGAEAGRAEDVAPALRSAIEAVERGQTAVVDVHVSGEMADAPIVHWWPV